MTEYQQAVEQALANARAAIPVKCPFCNAGREKTVVASEGQYLFVMFLCGTQTSWRHRPNQPEVESTTYAGVNCAKVRPLPEPEPPKAPEPKPRAKKPIWKLYWCWTPDHEEDWFIVAYSALEARRAHEAMEGYDTDFAECELIADIPDHLQDVLQEGWPDQATIEACGGVFLPGRRLTEIDKHLGQGGRVVRFGERVFKEGKIGEGGTP